MKITVHKTNEEAERVINVLQKNVIKDAALMLVEDDLFCNKLVTEIEKEAYCDVNERATITSRGLKDAIQRAAGIEVK